MGGCAFMCVCVGGGFVQSPKETGVVVGGGGGMHLGMCKWVSVCVCA